MKEIINEKIRKQMVDLLRIRKAVALVILACAIAFCGVDMFPVNAQTTDSYNYITSKSWITPAVIHDEDSASPVTKRGDVKAPVFDSRSNGWVTPVKDQGNYETCWSFATAATLETNLIKNGLAGADIDISENSIAYFFYNRQTDKLEYTKGDYNMIARPGYDYLTASGTLQGTGIALTTGVGLHTESQSPYLTVPSPDMCYVGDYVVKNMYLYNYDTNNLTGSVQKIKQAITDHGAVAAGIFFTESFYNKDNSSYYCTSKGGNHAITIVGWDDNYSKDKFSSTPVNNGAWIVKNSYGTSFGDNGYIYISYEDKSISELMSFETIRKESDYNNYYQHDGSGNPAYAYNSAEWYANVFKAKGAGDYNEELKAISIFTTTVGTQYEVQVYTGLNSASKPTGGTKAFSSSVKGSFSDAGYQMIELPEPVSLTAGEYFSVLVKLTDASGKYAYMGVDTTYFDASNDWIRFIADVGKNQSFIKANGKWYDMGKKLKANARIKAYTDITSVKSGFHLNTSKLGVSKGDTQTLSLVAAEHVHRKVTWKTSNSSIASVSTSGKVKGKKYGTTTVSGTFVNGSGKKTLKCKITVGPARMKGFKVSADDKVKVSWKKNSSAEGYEIYYAPISGEKFVKLATIKSNGKTSCSKVLPSGTYYVKMRPYMKSGKKKLYGSYTAAKEVIVP